MAYKGYDLNGLRITLLYTSLPLHFVILYCFLFLRRSTFWWEQMKMQI